MNGLTAPGEPSSGAPEADQLSRSGAPVGEPGVPGPGCLAAVGWLVLLVLLQTAFVLPFAAAFADKIGGPEPIIGLEFATLGLFLAAAFIVWRQHGRNAWRAFAIRLPGRAPTVLTILLALPLCLALGEVSAWTANGLHWINGEELARFDVEGLHKQLRTYPAWLAVVMVAIFGGLLPALGEELFFRGFIGRGLVARWRPAWGILFTSVLFGLTHVYLLSIVNAVLMGAVLHAVYLWARSLVAPVLLHAGFNGLVFSFNALYYEAVVDQNAKTGEHAVPVLAIASFAATIGLLLLLFRSRVRWMTADGSEWSPGFTTAETPPTPVDALPVNRTLSRPLVMAVAVGYLLFLAILGWELSR